MGHGGLEENGEHSQTHRKQTKKHTNDNMELEILAAGLNESHVTKMSQIAS